LPFAKIAKIAVKTASVSCKTSLFQNLKTRHPILFKYAERWRSSSSFSACCPPSTSITTFFSTQIKSTIKVPTGYCRRNFQPPSSRLRRCRQSSLSASVICFRKALANCLDTYATPHPNPLPSQGRGGKAKASPRVLDLLPCYLSPTIVVGRVLRAMSDPQREKIVRRTHRTKSCSDQKDRRAVPALHAG
jgi:hypothetical protein